MCVGVSPDIEHIPNICCIFLMLMVVTLSITSVDFHVVTVALAFDANTLAFQKALPTGAALEPLAPTRVIPPYAPIEGSAAFVQIADNPSIRFLPLALFEPSP